MNLNMTRGQRKHVVVGHSTIPDAGWGLFSVENIRKHDFIIEYIGEKISQEEAERRGHWQDKKNCSYLFNLNTADVIDSARRGNKSKFINHSTVPNCYTRIVIVNGSDHRIGVYALRDIEPHTELFFNYHYDKKIEHAELSKSGVTPEWMRKR